MRGLILGALLIAAATQPAAARVLALGDMARIVDLEEPALSPNGHTAAFVTIAQDMKRNAYVNALVLIDTRTGVERALVRGGDVAVPRWSPDGSRLAYLARPSENAPLQLFVRTTGGRAVALTHAVNDVIDAAWSPDGTRLAFVAADAPSTSPFFYAGDNDYTASELTPADHIWIVPVNGGSARRLTSGSWTVAPTDPGGIFSPQIAWSHGGRSIVFTRVESTFSGDDERSTLWRVVVGSGAMTKLTTHPQFELSPAFAPDGTSLTYWYPLHGDYNSENTLRIVQDGHDRAAAESFDRNVAGALWYPGGRRLLVCAADGTQNRAWTLELDGTMRPIDLGNHHIVCDPYSSSTFDAGAAADVGRDGTIVFIATDARHARELFVLDAGAGAPRQLTHFNDFLSTIDIGTMTELRWQGPDGFAEDGVVTYPPGYGRNGDAASYPAVLLIHGGPGLSNATDFLYEQWPLAQMIASRGYVVLQPNYRGSDNLGNAYMIGIVGNTVVGPSADIMASLAALERTARVDRDRVAVSGWSYGGELTSWLIGHYQGWRAAVSGAAVNNEFDEYNLSTSNVQDRYPLLASPWVGDGERIYRENSPITYFRQISTPTLIWGTTLDPVVPITQAYELFHALQENHVPVQFAVFPASTHGPSNPVQTEALTRLWLNWLDTYLR